VRPALGALVFALALALYWPVRSHAWLAWDDELYVSRNAEVQRGIDAQSLRWAFTSEQGANWFPLTRLSWLLDVELHGDDAGGFLLTNVLLHALASALFFAALAAMTGELALAFFAAALFAVHPLHVESVAWIAARKDVLSGVCFMLALLAHARVARAPGRRGPRIAVFVWLLLGLLAKPMLVTLPCVLLLLDAWPLGRLTDARGRIDARRVRAALREKLPLFALALASSLVTLHAQAQGGVVASLERLPIAARVGNALVAYATYLRRFAWPSDLAAFYPHAGAALPLSHALFATALLAGASALVWRAWPRRPPLAVGWLWFLGMLVPTIGLVQVGSQALADRYMYLPLAGLALALAFGAGAAWRGRARPALAAAALLLLVLFAFVSRQQLRFWQDDVTLFTRALAVTRDNHVAHAQLGAALERRGQTAETIRHYREAVRIRPDHRTALNNLAWLLATAKDSSLREPALAVTLAERAAKLPPGPDAAVLDTLAAAYAAAGRFDEAVATAERALAQAQVPALAEALRARLALYRAGRAWSE
jgi:tetratricopeptide (TPR) repeat protein